MDSQNDVIKEPSALDKRPLDSTQEATSIEENTGEFGVCEVLLHVLKRR